MKRNTKIIMKIILITVMTLLQLFAFYNSSLAALAEQEGNPITNPRYYMPAGMGDAGATEANKLRDMANIIIGALQIIGTILSVAMLGVLGIKYMMGSVEERAEYKKTLMPYLIGAIMVFGITNILAIVSKIAQQLWRIRL